MKRLFSRILLLSFGSKLPTKKTDVKPLVMAYARGNTSLKSGNYLTQADVEKQRKALAKRDF